MHQRGQVPGCQPPVSLLLSATSYVDTTDLTASAFAGRTRAATPLPSAASASRSKPTCLRWRPRRRSPASLLIFVRLAHSAAWHSSSRSAWALRWSWPSSRSVPKRLSSSSGREADARFGVACRAARAGHVGHASAHEGALCGTITCKESLLSHLSCCCAVTRGVCLPRRVAGALDASSSESRHGGRVDLAEFVCDRPGGGQFLSWAGAGGHRSPSQALLQTSPTATPLPGRLVSLTSLQPVPADPTLSLAR